MKIPESFPLLISAGYHFYSAAIMGKKCILAVANKEMHHTPRMVDKQLRQVKEHYGTPVVFAAHELHAHDKERYIALRVPLIVPGRLIFLPFLGTLQETPQHQLVVTRNEFSTLAQLVVLAYLENKLTEPITIQQVTELLQVTSPAVQNVFKELEYFGFAERRKLPGARTLELVFNDIGQDLWNKAQDYLTSPVRKVVGLESVPSSEPDCTIAGVDALATLGRLNDQPHTQFAFAMEGFAKRRINTISTLGAPYQAQLWAYSPTKLGGNNIDLLSLILSLRDEKDDRVRIEIDRLLEEFPW